MTRTQELADEVRAVVASGDHTLSDRLTDLAREFASVCGEAEGRLRRCEGLIRRGLRAEAIHQADLEPSLLDTLTRLAFPERELWDQITSLYGLPQAPSVNAHRADELNRAYAEHQPLEATLKRHRLLARTRAPEGNRLAVLRELGRLDPNNPVWAEDAAVFEAPRHRQLAADVERAVQARDAVGLETLYLELTAPEWQHSPPANLVARVARNTLHQLTTQLSRSLQAKDAIDCRRLRDQIQDRLKLAMLPEDDPIAVKAQKLLPQVQELDFWLMEGEQFDQAVSELSFALEDPTATQDRIEALYDRASLFKRKIPTAVEIVYERRVGEFGRTRDFRNTVLSVILVAIGCMVLVGFILLIVGMR